MKHTLNTSLLLLLISLPAVAAPSLPPIFGDAMVLQRERAIPVWGEANPGEQITVSFHEQEKQTKADENGRWRIMLDAEDASPEPSSLVVSGEGKVEIRNVLVGDVWVCSGQSNMQLELKKTKGSSGEIAKADIPMLREFSVKRSAPESPMREIEGSWVPCTPKTAGGFSAIGYYFARALQANIEVPIGLINSSWGGTTLEGWMEQLPEEKQSDAYKRMIARWKAHMESEPAIMRDWERRVKEWTDASAKAKREGRKFTEKKPSKPLAFTGGKFNPSSVHNAMMHPLYQTPVRGILWYQGESNASRLHDDYAALFMEMIGHWRAGFGQERLPFYYVQLPGYLDRRDATEESWARIREAQAKALALPDTGMVVTIDLGGSDNIHPTGHKQDIAARLARLALVKTYGFQGLVESPSFESMTLKGRELKIRFKNAQELVLKGKEGFEIAGSDGVFYPADAHVKNGELIVSSRKVGKPAVVRYAWGNVPKVCLFNKEGLPASPFFKKFN